MFGSNQHRTNTKKTLLDTVDEDMAAHVGVVYNRILLATTWLNLETNEPSRSH